MINANNLKNKYKRIMISAISSGSGKTLITCGLLNILNNEYENVQAFKCGPDYIDPLFHKNVLSISSRNLDSFFSDKDSIVSQIKECNKEINVIEGAMGIYDGLGSVSAEGSAYEIASVTKTPIILIVDAKGMGQTVVSVINGILSGDVNCLVKGIILNRISEHFYNIIKPVIEERTGIKVFGYVPVLKQVYVPSRHLGLVMPEEINNIKEIINTVSECMIKTVDIRAVEEVMSAAEDLNNIKPCLDSTELRTTKIIPESQHSIIAVAHDEAFCFIYEANIELLKNLGAEIVEFSPIHDCHLPERYDALYFPGGYPENYLEELSENNSMKKEILNAYNNNVPIWAECGGFMYLHESISGTGDERYSMVGAIPGNCYNTGKLVRFGYIDIKMGDTCTIKGHEFHYYDTDNNGEELLAVKPIGNKSWRCMYYDGAGRIMGFPHLYLPSNINVARRFIESIDYCFKGK